MIFQRAPTLVVIAEEREPVESSRPTLVAAE
jgi:hypothetical protein